MLSKQKAFHYVINPGDGAFYGPKLDYHIEDSLGRTWQMWYYPIGYELA